MRHRIASFLSRLSNLIDGSGWNYDEFDHGYREGLREGRKSIYQEDK